MRNRILFLVFMLVAFLMGCSDGPMTAPEVEPTPMPMMPRGDFVARYVNEDAEAQLVFWPSGLWRVNGLYNGVKRAEGFWRTASFDGTFYVCSRMRNYHPWVCDATIQGKYLIDNGDLFKYGVTVWTHTHGLIQ